MFLRCSHFLTISEAYVLINCVLIKRKACMSLMSLMSLMFLLSLISLYYSTAHVVYCIIAVLTCFKTHLIKNSRRT